MWLKRTQTCDTDVLKVLNCVGDFCDDLLTFLCTVLCFLYLAETTDEK